MVQGIKSGDMFGIVIYSLISDKREIVAD